MNVLNKVTWSAMWKNRTRTIVTIIGIILSAAMFTAVTTLGVSARNFLIATTIQSSGDYFLRFDYSSDDQLEQASGLENVSEMGILSALGYTTLTCTDERGEHAESYVVAAGDDHFFDMIPLQLEEGRLPENGDEMVITRNSYFYLQKAGKPCELGDLVTLDVFPDYIPEEGNIDLGLPEEGEAFTKTYRIVGIAEYFTYLEDHSLNRSHLFTKADGAEDALWHRIFLKTNPPMAAHTLQNRQLGLTHSLNGELLALYGASKYINYNHFLYAICGVLIAIIMVGSVSLIYNAFSISVSERTKQFGLLSSIGATKKQLRKSVYFEAVALSVIAVPFGIVFGYTGIAVTLYLIRDLLEGILPGTANGAVVLRAVPSLPAFLCAALVTVFTTFLSALIPARRGTRVDPISAIRQTQDYKIPKRLPKGRRSIFGFPGVLSRKYYQVSKSKYRSTVVSLSIAMVLFLAASGFSQVLQSTVQEAADATNFDLICYQVTREQIEEIRNLPGVTKSTVQTEKSFMTVLEEEDCTGDYLAIWENGEYGKFKYLYLVYLEDTEFEALLRENGLDPQDYRNSPQPPAILSDARIYRYLPNEDGAMVRYTYEAEILNDGIDQIPVYPDSYPAEVHTYAGSILGYPLEVKPTTVNGTPVWVFKPFAYHSGTGTAAPDNTSEAVYVTIQNTGDQVSYHAYDPDTDTVSEEAICTEGLDAVPRFRIVGSCSAWPYGTAESISFGGSQICLWLPLSTAGDVAEQDLELVMNTSSHQSVLDYLDENGILYADYRSDEIYQRNLRIMVDVFSYGFIILISLICVCNIFNTISTNIALRRRDFGMLRSVGMENRALRRMLKLECLRYGCIASLWGLPLGVAADYGIFRLTLSISHQTYQLPWWSIGIALGCSFGIVFASMAYALSKLKKDDPIEAIRMENI